MNKQKKGVWNASNIISNPVNHPNPINHSSYKIRLPSSLRALRNSLCSLRLKSLSIVKKITTHHFKKVSIIYFFRKMFFTSYICNYIKLE